MDPSKEYKQGRVKNVLPRVLPGAKKGSFCKKECYNTQKLKNHLKKRHLVKTSYEYKVCNKFFADSGTLKINSRKHQASGPSLKCTQCGKRYVSLAKLNEHK